MQYSWHTERERQTDRDTDRQTERQRQEFCPLPLKKKMCNYVRACVHACVRLCECVCVCVQFPSPQSDQSLYLFWVSHWFFRMWMFGTDSWISLVVFPWTTIRQSPNPDLHHANFAAWCIVTATYESRNDALRLPMPTFVCIIMLSTAMTKKWMTHTTQRCRWLT